MFDMYLFRTETTKVHGCSRRCTGIDALPSHSNVILKRMLSKLCLVQSETETETETERCDLSDTVGFSVTGNMETAVKPCVY